MGQTGSRAPTTRHAHGIGRRYGRDAPESEGDEYLMLLELAASLQQWPPRNPVCRKALDRAADDLVRMAGEAGTV